MEIDWPKMESSFARSHAPSIISQLTIVEDKTKVALMKVGFRIIRVSKTHGSTQNHPNTAWESRRLKDIRFFLNSGTMP